MFRAVKSSYELEVSLRGSVVRVKPLQANEERGFFLRTLARCEEFLAQVFLREHTTKDALSNLALHFKNRGWQVQ